MMDFEWKPSVKTVLRCLSTFSGLRTAKIVRLMFPFSDLEFWWRFEELKCYSLSDLDGPQDNNANHMHFYQIWTAQKMIQQVGVTLPTSKPEPPLLPLGKKVQYWKSSKNGLLTLENDFLHHIRCDWQGLICLIAFRVREIKKDSCMQL